VAEKAGAWSESLALYEQALSQEAAAAAASTAAPAAQPGSGSGGAGGAGLAAADALIAAARALVSGSGQEGAGGPGAALGLSSWFKLEQPPAAEGASAAAALGLSGHAASISGLQVGQLRCLLQMGHHQTLLRQVDGLMARALGQAAAAAATPAAAAAVAAAAAAAGGTSDAQSLLNSAAWSVGQLSALGVAAAWRLGAWQALRGYLSVLEAAGNSPDGVLRPLSAADRWEVRVLQSRAVCPSHSAAPGHL
jgi:hypothetical protein